MKNIHSNHRLLFSTILIGFIVLSVALAVGPAIWVEQNMQPIEGTSPLTELEKEGLKIYVGEGCVGCHSQQIRPLEMDSPYGRASIPADYAHHGPLGPFGPYAPGVLGTQRTGPDLADVGTRQPSDVWQYIHLYNPRAVVPDSIMPGYPWLFEVVEEAGPDDVVVPITGEYAPDEGQLVATEKAQALVAYMLALKQAPLESAEVGHE